MLTPERITALPTAEELEEGYYLLVDSPTLGTRKIAVENFIPPAELDLYRWDFTKSLTDEVQGITAEFMGQNASGITRDAQGLHINNSYQSVYLGEIDLMGCIVEIEVGEMNLNVITSQNSDLLTNSSAKENCTNGGTEALYYKANVGWCSYGYVSSTSSSQERHVFSSSLSRNDAFNNKNIKLYFSYGSVSLYVDDVLINKNDNQWFNTDNHSCGHLFLFGYNKYNGSWYNGNIYNITVKKVRIYKNQRNDLIYNWDFTNSLIDTVNGTEFAIFGGATQGQNGITFSNSNQFGKVLTPINMNNKTLELDVASFDASSQDTDISVIMNTNFSNPYYNTGALRWSNSNNYWGCYLENDGRTWRYWSKWADGLDKTFFSGKTIKIKYEDNNRITLFVNDEIIGTLQDSHTYFKETGLFIGGFDNANADGNYFYNAVITGLRIYDNEYISE